MSGQRHFLLLADWGVFAQVADQADDGTSLVDTSPPRGQIKERYRTDRAHHRPQPACGDGYGRGPFRAGPPPHGLRCRGGVESSVRRGLADLFAAFEVQAGQAAVEEAR